MSAAPVSLDQGPPLPQNLQPQQASAAQLAGPQQQAQQSGSADLSTMVAQTAMGIEKGLVQLAQLLPNLSGSIDSWINQFRKQVGTELAKGVSPQPAQQPGMGGSLLMSVAPPGS